MSRVALALLMAGWALCASARNESPDLRARIARVEHGLRDPVTVRGAPERTMRLEDRMRALHVPGLSVAVIDHGDIEWVRAYGTADRASGRPVTPDTLFQAASISKPVTAVLALRLAAQGRIDLDEDVNRQLHGWQLPANAYTRAQAVTPRLLLSHTAGLPGFDLPGYGVADPQPTLLQILQGAAPATNPAVQVGAAPGSRHDYSGLGYTVLQQYLTDATGQPFAALARDLVFQPLGMSSTRFAPSLPPAEASAAALGHQLDGSVVAGGWRRYPELAAAGLWTSATDLARFVIALQRAAQGQADGFLTAQQAAALLTPVRNEYGLGFELDHRGTQPVFHHSGSNAGFKALMFAYTRTGQGAVILTNGDAGWPLIQELMRSIAAEYGWEDYRPIVRAAAPARPELYERFVGDYKVSNVTLHVTRDGDRLLIAGPPLGPAAVELIPAGDYDFFAREKNVDLHFDSSGSGPAQTINFIDGRPRAGKRIAAGAAPQ